MAGFITALAVGSFLLAGYIKKQTYRSPNDALAPSGGVEHAPVAEPAAGDAKH